MWCVENFIYLFLVTYCKIFHPKSPFYEKMKMITKRIIVLESFITVGSFDRDHTLLEDPKYHKHECTILWCCYVCCAFLRWVHSPQCSWCLDLKGILGMYFAMKKRWRSCMCFFKHGLQTTPHYSYSCNRDDGYPIYPR
jgi:hypothetical protein